MIKYLVSVSLICSFFSCSNSNQKFKGEYFSLSDYLLIQKREMPKSNYHTHKIITLNDGTCNRFCDKIDFEKELKPFEILELNRPINKGVFGSVAFLKDSNLINMYVKKSKQKSKIAYEKVVFTRSNKVKSVAAKLRTKNPVFESEKTMQLTFDTTTLLLTSYSIEGWQKFQFMDKETYSVIVNFSY